MEFSEGFWEQFKDKKVVLYGADTSGFAFLYWAEKAGVEVAYLVDRNVEKQKMIIMGKEVKAPIELMYENCEEIKIVITSHAKKSIVKTLTDMGFSRDKQIVTEFIENRMGPDLRLVDALLGASRGEKIPYELNNKNSDNEIVIVVVGGSTTDPLYGGINSWSFYLQKIIDSNGITARVVNIAERGYASSQELLVLLRDGLAIKPNVVISYSGWNDISPAFDIEGDKRYPYTGRYLYLAFQDLLRDYGGTEPFGDIYYGKLEADTFERYITNMRLMHAMCIEFDCKFYGLLQPSLTSIPVELLQSSFAKKAIKDPLITDVKKKWDIFYSKYSSKHSAYSYLYDFTHILDGHDDVLEDTCHVNEEGNRIIAENIFNLLLEQKVFERE